MRYLVTASLILVLLFGFLPISTVNAANSNLPATESTVTAQDFTVLDSPVVKGYNVGFGLIDAKASDVSSAVVKLYNGETVLATATATGLMTQYPDTATLSAPFDVLGSFDYEDDGAWEYSGWTGPKYVIPTKAEITVTYKNDVVATATNEVLTGDTSIFTSGDVTARAFGVENRSNGVKGYNVGLTLVDATVADASNIEIELYNGETLLATVAASPKLLDTLPTAYILSAPLDVMGTFNYEEDGYWEYSGWTGPKYVIPTKAVITVTYKNDVVAVAETTNLSGDTTIFTKGSVTARAFGVENRPVNGMKGYNVGLTLVDATLADAKSIEIKLYNGVTLQATVAASPKVFETLPPTTTALTAPLDVMGTFNYVADGYWTYSGWTGPKYVIPTKAEITVTYKNDVVATVTNEVLTGDTTIFTKGDVVAQDFGVWTNPDVNMKGYNVGFGLIDAVASDVSSVEVRLLEGETVLAILNSVSLMAQYPDTTTLSAPFDVLGSFDYEADGAWEYSGWPGFRYIIPNKAEITVTFKNDIVKTVVNTNLTGDTSIFTKGDVTARAFGVENRPVNGMKGYNVGLTLVDATVADAKSIEIELYNGETLLAIVAASPKVFGTLPTAKVLNAPIDVLGTFDYEKDGYWLYDGWIGPKYVIPTKAEITVTYKNDVVATVTNEVLTGDTTIFTKGDVVAQDFGVWTNPDVNMKGYNVGFGLIDAVASDVSSIVVKLYKGEAVLATATSAALLTQYPDVTTLSAPFDVLGSFNYEDDGAWEYSGWNGLKNVIPDKAEIIVTFKNDVVKTAVNTTLTGETTIFTKKPAISNIHIESNNEDPTQAKAGDIITLSFTADEPVSKTANFKINGKAPVTFTNVGNDYTATYVVDAADLETGEPVSFVLCVVNGSDNGMTLEATTDDSFVTIYQDEIKIWLPIITR